METADRARYDQQSAHRAFEGRMCISVEAEEARKISLRDHLKSSFHTRTLEPNQAFLLFDSAFLDNNLPPFTTRHGIGVIFKRALDMRKPNDYQIVL